MRSVRVPYETAQSLIQAWASEQGISLNDVLNMALMRRTSLCKRDFDGRVHYLERLWIVTGLNEFKLTPEEERRAQKTNRGVDEGVRREISQFLSNRFRNEGTLPNGEEIVNLPERKTNPISNVIRHFRSRGILQLEKNGLNEGGDALEASLPFNPLEEVDAEVNEDALRALLSLARTTTLYFEILFKTGNPESIRALRRMDLEGLKQLARHVNTALLDEPIKAFQYFEENRGRSLVLDS